MRNIDQNFSRSPVAPSCGTACSRGRRGAVCRAEVYRDREPKFPILLGLIYCAALTLALVAHAGQKKVPPGSVFVQEKGKFDILLEGKSVGHEEFDIAPGGAGWVAKGTTKLTPPGSPTSTVTGNLVLQADGAPVSYAWTSQADKTNGAHIVFVNGIAKMTLEIQGARPFEQDLSFNSPLITVLDNNLYHQYGLLARMYDWSRRGTQTFSVLIPQDLTPGSITVDWAGAVSSDGKAYEGLKVVTSDLEVMLYLEPNHKLMRLEVPSAKVAVVRQ